jgi:CRISPR-associated protein Cas1
MQTVKAKIRNQGLLLKELGKEHEPMFIWEKEVHSGDTTNKEGRAAVYYWKHLFAGEYADAENFSRERYGAPPNNLLNYGYAVLRAIVARSLVGSGLLPTLGIHHHNQYNAYCLADDIMEPFRPFVDRIVVEMVREEVSKQKSEVSRENSGEVILDSELLELTPTLKKKLLEIPVIDISLGGELHPLMVGMQQTTASLARCFQGIEKEIVYPRLDVRY